MTVTRQTESERPRIGRRPSTTHDALEAVALELFTTRGFDETSIDDIAAAAGIARRTFFRYYPSKSDLVWGEFDAELDRMRAWFAAAPPDVPMMEAIRQAVIEFNRLPPDQVHQHRRRMSLILGVPTLLANSTLRFAQWREVLATFAAGRLGLRPDDLLPRGRVLGAGRHPGRLRRVAPRRGERPGRAAGCRPRGAGRGVPSPH